MGICYTKNSYSYKNSTIENNKENSDQKIDRSIDNEVHTNTSILSHNY